MENIKNTNEKFMVRAFACIDLLNLKIKEINKKILELYTQEDQIKEKINSLNEEYNQLLLLNIGKGKYYYIEQEYQNLKNRLNNLHDSIYDPYNGLIDKKSEKKYELLRGPLNEDIDEAKRKVDELNKYKEDVYNKYNQYSEDLKKCKNEIKILRKKLSKIEIDRNKITASVKMVEKLTNNNRRIGNKHYLLIKKYENNSKKNSK